MTFNDHEGSTKSYAYTREHYEPAVHADFVPLEREITADYKEGETVPVVMHDGSRIVLRKLDAGYDPTNRTRGRGADPGAHEGGRIPHRACCTSTSSRRRANSTTSTTPPTSRSTAFPTRSCRPDRRAWRRSLARYR